MKKHMKPATIVSEPAASSSPQPPLRQKGPPLPIVGIGASAGGLEALEQFLREVPLSLREGALALGAAGSHNLIVNLSAGVTSSCVTVLTTSGPASVGLLYKESVGTIMSEAQFIEAVGLSNILPGSEALKLAMFVGFAAGGLPGVITALVGAVLPPTIIMLTVVSVLERFQGETWMQNFVKGMVLF